MPHAKKQSWELMATTTDLPIFRALGQLKKAAGGTVINFKTSKENCTLFGETPQMGSRVLQYFTTGSFAKWFNVLD